MLEYLQWCRHYEVKLNICKQQTTIKIRSIPVTGYPNQINSGFTSEHYLMYYCGFLFIHKNWTP